MFLISISTLFNEIKASRKMKHEYAVSVLDLIKTLLLYAMSSIIAELMTLLMHCLSAPEALQILVVESPLQVNFFLLASFFSPFQLLLSYFNPGMKGEKLENHWCKNLAV